MLLWKPALSHHAFQRIARGYKTISALVADNRSNILSKFFCSLLEGDVRLNAYEKSRFKIFAQYRHDFKLIPVFSPIFSFRKNIADNRFVFNLNPFLHLPV